LLKRRYQEAARSIELLIDNFIAKGISGIRPLDRVEVSFYGEQFSQGWEIPGLCEAVPEYKFRILLPSLAPFASSRIAVWPEPPILEWPHLEEKGLLCLMSDMAVYSIYDCAGVTKEILKDAVELVGKSVAGVNITDFEDEFQSYWKRWGTAEDNYMYTCCFPDGPSRWISSWHSQGGLIVADNETALLRWMEHRYGQDTRLKIKPQNIPLLWLPRPLRPKEYPKSVNMLRSILRELNVDDSLLKRLIADVNLTHHSIVLGFNARQGGVGFAGLSISRPTMSLKNGFRKSPPENVIVTRYSTARITTSQPIRLDGPWVHGRDNNEKVKSLLKKKVVLFGIGSIGSFVAQLLAMSGVGELILVDPEILSSENTGRHVLGIDSINMNKAVKLADDLNTRFPHLKISGNRMTCETFCTSKLYFIQNADLIISTIGSWRSEGWLNTMANDSSIQSPILYGWMESHAAAGHAVVFQKKNVCLRCIRDDIGHVKIPVSSWPEGSTMIPVPSCGGSFQPYGAIEISHIHGLIAGLALDVLLENTTTSAHRIWIGSEKIIEHTGGVWNPSWIERYGEPGKGGFLKDIEIQPDPQCPECGRYS
jgi:sulfur-carrier protein adenylyltransferase/sulfurtransferase